MSAGMPDYTHRVLAEGYNELRAENERLRFQVMKKTRRPRYWLKQALSWTPSALKMSGCGRR